MSFFSGIKKIVKPLVDVPKWIGYRQLVKTNRLLFSFVKKFFVPDQTLTQESFQSALDRLKLTDVELSQRVKEFTRLMWIWIFLFLITMTYSIHLLRQSSFRGFFPCLGVSVIILTQVFRYHFWIFQIKQRRLGCSFREWLAAQLTFGTKKQ